jgi:hypothetical protein
LRGWRSMPGSIPATSQLDWLISTTAMIVLSSEGDGFEPSVPRKRLR